MTLRDFRDQYAYDTRKRLRQAAATSTAAAAIPAASGTGSPEGVVTAPLNTLYLDIATGNTYRKTTATSNTGWVST